MSNVKEFIAQYHELNEMCRQIHKTFIVVGHYDHFVIDETDDPITIKLSYGYDSDMGVGYIRFPLDVAAKGLSATFEWFAARETEAERKRAEYERQRLEKEIAAKELQEKKEYERLKRKFGG